jgi:hypothetical protein
LKGDDKADLLTLKTVPDDDEKYVMPMPIIDRETRGKAKSYLASLEPDEREAQYKTEELKIADLQSGQDSVNKETVNYFLNGGKPGWMEEFIRVARVNGKLYLMNGNHRVVASMLQGAKSVQAKVIDVPSLSKSDFVESEHPRNADGEWTDKGGGESNGLRFKVTDNTDKPPEQQFYPYYRDREEVEKDFLKHEKAYDKKLSDEEKNMLSLYAEEGGNINMQLRGIGSVNDYEFTDKDIGLIDSALEKASFPKRAIVARYMAVDMADFNKLGEWQGKIIQDAGFLSTSLEQETYAPLVANYVKDMNEEEGGEHAVVVMNIRIPKGAHAGLIFEATRSASEVLLQRNARLRVRHVYDVPDKDYGERFGDKIGVLPTKYIELDLLP